jgi:hypothetical protein
LLEHIEDLRAGAFSDNMAFAPYVQDPDRMLMTKHTSWYLNMEVHAPDCVRDQSNKVMDALYELGGAREIAWTHSRNPQNASQLDVETNPQVEQAHAQ